MTETEHAAEIVRLHAEGRTDDEIAAAVGCKRHVVWYYRKTRGIPANRSKNFLTQYNGCFAPVSTWASAYCLGFICADGCASPRNLEIYIHQQDESVLNYVRSTVGSRSPITVGRTDEHGTYVKLRVNCKRVLADLAVLGVTPRKSLTLEWPEAIPDHLRWAFVLGYCDGDGSIAIYELRKVRPGRKIPETRAVVAVTCSWLFAPKLRDFLADHGVNAGVYPHGKNKRVALVTTASFIQSAAWLRLMYQGAEFCLPRKKHVALQIIDREVMASAGRR